MALALETTGLALASVSNITDFGLKMLASNPSLTTIMPMDPTINMWYSNRTNAER